MNSSLVLNPLSRMSKAVGHDLCAVFADDLEVQIGDDHAGLFLAGHADLIAEISSSAIPSTGFLARSDRFPITLVVRFLPISGSWTK